MAIASIAVTLSETGNGKFISKNFTDALSWLSKIIIHFLTRPLPKAQNDQWERKLLFRVISQMKKTEFNIYADF